jgi:hypothetical protein
MPRLIISSLIICCVQFLCFRHSVHSQPLPPSNPHPLCDSTTCDTLNLTGPLTYTTPVTPGGGDTACYVTITYWKRQCSQYYDVIIDSFSYHGTHCSTLELSTIISRASAMLLMNKLGDTPLPFPPNDSADTRTWRMIKPSCWRTQTLLEHGDTDIVPCTPYQCCVSYYKAKRPGSGCPLYLTWIPVYTKKPECGTVEDPHSFQEGCWFHCEENVLDSFKD